MLIDRIQLGSGKKAQDEKTQLGKKTQEEKPN